MKEERRIIEILQNVESLSRAEPAAAIDFQYSKATLKRELKRGKTVLRIGAMRHYNTTRIPLTSGTVRDSVTTQNEYLISYSSPSA